jgi:hypothetical protein
MIQSFATIRCIKKLFDFIEGNMYSIIVLGCLEDLVNQSALKIAHFQTLIESNRRNKLNSTLLF